MKLAVLLLCHESPAQVARGLASPFFASPDVKVYLHYDAKRPQADLARLTSLLPETVQHQVLAQRVACAWGEYSLVEATHRLMRAALSDPAFEADYLLLLSGSCMPIRPLSSLQEFLRRRRGIDFIQAVDIQQRSWVKDGLERERFQYYFPFNFQKQRRLFETATEWQRRLKIRRPAPEGLRVHFGSQWFCLTRNTAAKVAGRLDEPGLQKFFADSWIPDEFAVQTLVAAEQKPAFIAGHNLTYYEFDAQGRPLVLDNGHFEHLLQQPFFFARKVSPYAGELVRQVNGHVGGHEYDLSYFSRAGHATNDYQRFLARALTVRTARAHVGTAEDQWRGMMDFNRRPYFVLYAASHRYLAALLQQARALGRLPLFDQLFDLTQLVPAVETGAWLGLQSGMRARRDHDPGAFLHEVVNIHPEHATAFALDAAAPCWARAFVMWDPNATLVCCDPPDLDKMQLAEAALREMSSAGDTQLLTRTLEAAAGNKWLPQDHFAEAFNEKKHSCQTLRLHQLGGNIASVTLRALKEAQGRVDAWQFYASRDVATERVRDALPLMR